MERPEAQKRRDQKNWRSGRLTWEERRVCSSSGEEGAKVMRREWRGRVVGGGGVLVEAQV